MGFDARRTTCDPAPDYTRPRPELPDAMRARLSDRLRTLYSEAAARYALGEIERLLQVFFAHVPPALAERQRGFDAADRFTERDVILITYGDLLYRRHQSPLETLGDFCDAYLGGAINTLHILPFFPSSSDRGFSVVDFETVDPLLGSWRDIEALESRYRLMFDGVINHVSSKSRWFAQFLAGHPDYEDFFTWYDSEDALPAEARRLIFRPRTTPILTRFESLRGPRFVWTTFSPDQVDLNYRNPRVLAKIIEVLLMYVRHGADILRLDAVTYLWDQPGTRSIHLDQTHTIVKLLRDVLAAAAPHVALVTETNVPHHENVAYFGDGTDEAHMVYNFALPPLVLHTFQTGDATALSRWAASLAPPSAGTAFFNFLDSHDGIGLLGAKGLLAEADLDRLCRRAIEHGGLVSYKTSDTGEPAPYELNITWYSALNRKQDGDTLSTQIRRFLASRAVALVLQGVPGIYLHSLFGTHNDHASVEATRDNRVINRAVADVRSVRRSLSHPMSKKHRINDGLGRMIQARAASRAFHPAGRQRVLHLSPAVFAVARTSPEGGSFVVTLVNVTASRTAVEIPAADLAGREGPWRDLLSERTFAPGRERLGVALRPYEVVWLAPV